MNVSESEDMFADDGSEEEENLQGFHEEYELGEGDDLTSTPEASCMNGNASHEQDMIRHLEWHCNVYRKAVFEFTNGPQVLKKVIEEERSKISEILCLSCEKDDLLTEIAVLRAKVGKLEAECKSLQTTKKTAE